ncbi:hypothetical protein Pcinc_025845 [Petrolisthes cinctipes]|uniref:Uncharacterized protein n=1 Tax=Petrolisthes cinctipes TaxID=88211 RepID=A0AAE1KBA5_PETCI|nr:hypothetical protein Pcinc_025845 [Petrolisthes cinctipes]
MKDSKNMIILIFYGSHIPDRININFTSFEALTKGVHVVEVHAATHSPKWNPKSTELQQRRLLSSCETLDSMESM